jgi:hypothetical protein
VPMHPTPTAVFLPASGVAAVRTLHKQQHHRHMLHAQLHLQRSATTANSTPPRTSPPAACTRAEPAFAQLSRGCVVERKLYAYPGDGKSDFEDKDNTPPAHRSQFRNTVRNCTPAPFTLVPPATGRATRASARGRGVHDDEECEVAEVNEDADNGVAGCCRLLRVHRPVVRRPVVRKAVVLSDDNEDCLSHGPRPCTGTPRAAKAACGCNQRRR